MKIFKTVALAALMAATPAAFADSLYQDLGGMAKIERITARLLDQTFTDPRTAPQFRQTKRERLEKLLNDQFCELAGGPGTYKGVNF